MTWSYQALWIPLGDFSVASMKLALNLSKVQNCRTGWLGSAQSFVSFCASHWDANENYRWAN